MAKRTAPAQRSVEPRQWTSTEEIDRAIAKIQRRIADVQALDIRAAVLEDTNKDDVAISNVRETIREVFGQYSPEFNEHEHIQMWAGGMFMGMDHGEIVESKERGRKQVLGTLNGLIDRLRGKRDELVSAASPSPKAYLDYLNVHPRIADVASDLFKDGYRWEAVFAAAKALVNYVKERSGNTVLMALR